MPLRSSWAGRAHWLSALMAAGACVAAGPEPASNDLQFSLRALDATQRPMALNALPRRPVFMLSGPRPLAGAELILLAGTADTDLLDDLADLPLQAAHEARRVPSDMFAGRGMAWETGWSGQSGDMAAWSLAPRTTLDAGAIYSLALPGNARVRGGPALNADGPAFVRELQTAADASAGARVVASAPAEGGSGVAPNLRWALLALDGDVTGEAEGAWLEAPDGLAVPGEVARLSCAELHSAAVRCIQLTPRGQLRANSAYALRTGAALRDMHTAPVESFTAGFTTTERADLAPPSFATLACARDELLAPMGCALIDDHSVSLRMRLDEPVRVLLRDAAVPARVDAQLWAAGSGQLRLTGLAAGAPLTLEVRAVDSAGNAVETSFAMNTAAELAPISITEVLADPRGPEPAQEYVEITNVGTTEWSLRDFALSDAQPGASEDRNRGSVIASSVRLAAGARALLVADRFDPASMLDTPPPAGTLLVRMGSSLTRAGLANSGEGLFLRDRNDRRLSAAPSVPPPRAGLCLQRLGPDPRSGDSKQFAQAACSPGR